MGVVSADLTLDGLNEAKGCKFVFKVPSVGILAAKSTDAPIREVM